MRDGLDAICRNLGGTLEGFSELTCQVSGETVPMPLQVVYWTGELPGREWPSWYDAGSRSLMYTRMTGSFVVEKLDWSDGDPRAHARMWGYFDVQPAFGVVDDTAPSTLLRPVLVR
jgi:hypothetical protein